MPGPLAAQDFAAPEPGWSATTTGLLERGLAPEAPGFAVESATIRWFGIPDLATVALAASGSWRGGRVAAGISRTGEAELGWTSVSLAAGWAMPETGVAVRACARRFGDAEAAAGLEAGIGIRMQAAPRLRLWASAPQLVWAGESPPLDRRLEMGALAEPPGLALWLTRAARPDASGEHVLGIAIRGGLLEVWAEAHDRPPRASLGVAARTGPVRIRAQVDSHPVLAETVRLGIGLGRIAPRARRGAQAEEHSVGRADP